MSTIRRLYLYAVAFVSLETVLWGLIALARSALSPTPGRDGRVQLAEALSFLLVGLPVFVLHIWLAQRQARADPRERFAGLRALFLYAAAFATLAPIVQNALAILDRLLRSALGAAPERALVGAGQSHADNLIAIAMNALVAVLLFTLLRQDWAARPQGEAYPRLRRFYRYAWSLYGLGMTTMGVQMMLADLLRRPAALRATSDALADGLALLLVGAPVVGLAWWRVQSSLADAGERLALEREVVLYLVSLVPHLMVLAGIGQLIFATFLWVTGREGSLAQYAARVSEPLSLVLSLGGVWRYFRPILFREIDARTDPQAREGRRRLYAYALSLAGLGATFVGVQTAVDLGLDVGVGGLAWGPELRERMAGSLATLVIGLPLWLWAWRPLVQEAGLAGELADHARRSRVRRGYLYLALFVGVVGAMFSAGALIFLGLRTLLASPPAELLLRSLKSGAMLLIFAGLAGYHWRVLRVDGRRQARALSEKHARFPVLLLDPGEGDFAAVVVAELQSELPDLPVAVHLAADGAPDETLSQASAVILPSSLAVALPEAVRLWLEAFRGERLVVPQPAEGWLWVVGRKVSLARQGQQVAQVVRALAEGEAQAG